MRHGGLAIKHVVMFSGGITSWAVAQRVTQKEGTDDVTLLFADTLVEDEDLYRFSRDVEASIGVPITRVVDGRTPWQVFRDARHIGNNRVAPCSRLLKQVPCRKWLEKHTDPVDTTVYVGIDWTETHRLPAVERGYAPWPVRAPLCDVPYLDKTQLLAMARDAGTKPPRLYELGFSHNNCGGACGLVRDNGRISSKCSRTGTPVRRTRRTGSVPTLVKMCRFFGIGEAAPRSRCRWRPCASGLKARVRWTG